MLISHDLTSHSNRPCAAALGFFDGVHQGHRAVIGRAREIALQKQVACGLFTFEPPEHTSRSVSKSDVHLLQSVQHRQEIMRSLGVELLCCPPFESFYDLTPEQFVRVLLHDAMHCVAVVCGEDYRFGCKGSGDVALLRELAAQYDIMVDTVPAVRFDGEVVSSTRIRNCLAAGELSLAGAMLCEPYQVEAPVLLRGDTLCQSVPAGMMPPAAGCYRACLLWGALRIPAAAQVVHGEDGVLLHTTLEQKVTLREGQTATVQLLSEV